MLDADREDATPYGQLDPLYWAVRRRYPQVAAACGREPSHALAWGAALTYLRVRYRGAGPWLVVWQEAAGEYAWHDGALLGADPERAADRIAVALGVPRSGA